MNKNKQHPWFGLDDVVSSMSFDDPKPLHVEKSQQEQDKALQHPEQSIDKEDRPWAQGADENPRDTEIGVNEVQDWENPPIDTPLGTGKKEKHG